MMQSVNLNGFLHRIPRENEKYVASQYLVDSDGQPIEWVIRPLTADEDSRLRRVCMKKVPVPGRKGVFVQELDQELYICKTAAACTVYPDLKDQVLQDACHVMGEESLLKELLLPGEYMEYIQKVQEINGFHTNMEELTQDAKN